MLVHFESYRTNLNSTINIQRFCNVAVLPKHNILTTTTANPTILIRPKGMRTDAMGSWVELKPVSLADTVTMGKMPLYVALFCSVLLSTELTRIRLEIVGTSVLREPGVYAKVGLKKLDLTVVRDMALEWRSWW